MLHKKRVLRALKGNFIRQLRILSGIKARPKAPVLSQPIENIVERHTKLCSQLKSLLPRDFVLKDTIVCEAGPGDCLATASLIIGLGATHVDLVEHQPPVVNDKQIRSLELVKANGFPIALDIIRGGANPTLDPDKISYHLKFMENFLVEEKYSLIYSFNVMEHVEDIAGFLASCYRALKPGGLIMHMIDLGGHGEFEDPLPPLDFQTYPDWLYSMMYPLYERATRRFVSEYMEAVKQTGFTDPVLHKLRVAEPDYFKNIQPKLRATARRIPADELAVIEFAVVAKKI